MQLSQGASAPRATQKTLRYHMHMRGSDLLQIHLKCSAQNLPIPLDVKIKTTVEGLLFEINVTNG